MQYKIPIQIENEDTIVAGLSLRQIIIIMIWGGIAYGLFRFIEPSLGPQIALVFAVPVGVIGIIIALIRIAEMTFLPTVLNFFRLGLNSKERQWSMGTDSYSELDIGYVFQTSKKSDEVANATIESKLTDEANQKINRL